MNEARISPRHVIALPDSYLKSQRPIGSRPLSLAPAEVTTSAAKLFPGARIGVGMLTNFSELNRCPPLRDQGDYLTHGNAAIAHAADDLSVLETLEALPYIFESGQLIAGKRAYRLGLVAIGMRSNPHAASLSGNREQRRKTMTDDDPRQKGLFAAAYAIGVTAKAANSGIEAITLGATGRPFRMRQGKLFYPIFHAVKALTAVAGKKVKQLGMEPSGLIGLRFEGGMIAANCSLEPVELTDPPLSGAILDITQFEAAQKDVNWLVSATKPLSDSIILGPSACLFAGVET